MKGKGYGRKQLCPNLRHYPGICLIKTTEKLSPSSRFAERDSNSGPPKYGGVLTTQPLYSVQSFP
jgi:hypothetical protein